MILYHHYVTLTDDIGAIRLQMFGPLELNRPLQTPEEYKKLSDELQTYAEEKFGDGHEYLKFTIVSLNRLN